MIWKLLQRTNRRNIVQAGLDKSKFENLPFSTNFNSLVKAYDLRMWYIVNSPNEAKNIHFIQELETLHNEINYQNSRRITISFKLSLSFFFFFLSYSIVLKEAV